MQAAQSKAATVEVADRLDAQKLCELYSERVYRFASMVSKGSVDSEDLAQDALERAIRAIGLYDSRRGTVDAWLWQIVVDSPQSQFLLAAVGQRRAGRWPDGGPGAAPALCRLGRRGNVPRAQDVDEDAHQRIEERVGHPGRQCYPPGSSLATYAPGTAPDLSFEPQQGNLRPALRRNRS